jgi:hypothetical protein
MADIRLIFKGAEYVIPDSRAFAAVDLVEEHITLGQMGRQQKDPQFGKISKAYGALLRFAGCKISDRAVYSEMMRAVNSGEPGAGYIIAMNHLATLALIVMEGAPLASSDDQGGAAEKTEAS